MTFEEYLSHPLFLLAVGSGITYLLGNVLTHSYQDKKHALEIKENLINLITESYSDIFYLVHGKYFHMQTISVERLEDLIIKWQQKSIIVKSMLKLYFPKEEPLHKRWHNIEQAGIEVIKCAKFHSEPEKMKDCQQVFFELLDKDMKKIQDLAMISMISLHLDDEIIKFNEKIQKQKPKTK